MDGIDWSLLTRYLKGSCTEAERRHVEEWMQQRPEHKRFVRRMQSIWRMSASPRVNRPPPDRYVDSDWERFNRKMRPAEGPAGKEHEGQPLPKWSEPTTPNDDDANGRTPSGLSLPYFLRVAAIVLIVLGGTLLFSQQHGDPSESVAASTFGGKREVVTKPGQQRQLTLSDGTMVQLNVDSKLRYPRSFVGPRRNVHLTGEAFFSVTSDSTRPFVVHTDGATVRVRGTAFGVRAYRGEENVKVIVTEGAVDLSVEEPLTGRRDSVSLTKNDVGHVVRGRLEKEVQRVNPAHDLGWQKGRLVFEDTPFRSVAAELERWYAIRIRIEDAQLARRPLTASFKNEPADAVLNVVATVLDATFDRDGSRVTFRPLRGAPAPMKE